MPMRRYLMAALMALPFCTAAASAGTHKLGITGVRGDKGGFRITNDVEPDTNAGVLGLKKGDVIVAIGNPAGGLPMAEPKKSTDIAEVMKRCGDHVLMFVTNSTGSKTVEGDLDADNIVSLPFPGVGDADGVVLVASATARHYEKFLQKKPQSVSKMWRHYKNREVRDKVRVIPGSVKHKKQQTPNWLAKYKARKSAKSARTAARRSHRAALALPARTEV
jgi:hypothetical protein